MVRARPTTPPRRKSPSWGMHIQKLKKQRAVGEKEKRFFCSEEGCIQDCRTEWRCDIINIGRAVAKEVTEMRVLPPWKKDPPPHGVASQKCHAVADKVTEIGGVRAGYNRAPRRCLEVDITASTSRCQYVNTESVIHCRGMNII